MDAVVKQEEDGIDVKKEVKIEEENGYQDVTEPKQEVINESFVFLDPKDELIDKTEMKKEETDDYQDVIPYEYRDYNGQNDVELQTVNIKKRKVKEVLSEKEKKRIQCQKCGKWIVSSRIDTTRQHAVIHTNLYRFECVAELCGYRNWRRYHVERHVESKHNGNMEYVKERKLTEEEKQELKNMNDICFPGIVEIIAQKSTDNSHQQHIPYKYRDNMAQPANSEEKIDGLSKQNRKRRAAGPLMDERRKQCQKCGKMIVVDCLVHAEQHAVTHTNVKRFECEVCGKKAWSMWHVKEHVKRRHGSDLGLVKGIELTEEEKLEVRRMVEECFPGAITQNEEVEKRMECRKCGKLINLNCFKHAESHASSHMDLKRFQCDQCDLKSWRRETVKRHAKTVHGTESCSVKDISLTEEQKMEIEKMVEECFPGVTNNQPIGTMVHDKDMKIEED